MERHKLAREIYAKIKRSGDALRRVKRHSSESVYQTQQDVWTHTAAFIENIKMKTEPYVVTVKEIDIIVDPNVFPPSTETRLIADYIHTSAGERILDITTGSGIDAVIAGLQGASGIAVDINSDAVNNARKNFERLGLNIQAIQSNLFENLPHEQFDLILCNPPYYDGEAKEPLGYALFGGRDFLTRFLKEAKSYMKPNGRILMTYAEWAGDSVFLEQCAKKEGYSYNVIGKKSSEDGKRIYRLYELTQGR